MLVQKDSLRRAVELCKAEGKRVGHGEVVPALIAAGAYAELADDDGTTSLMWAAYLGRDDVVGELLSHEQKREVVMKLNTDWNVG